MKTIACCLLFAALFVPSLKAEDKSNSASPVIQTPFAYIGKTSVESVVLTPIVSNQDEDTCQVESPITSTQDVPKKYCCFYLFHAICACESTSLDGCLTDCANWP